MRILLALLFITQSVWADRYSEEIRVAKLSEKLAKAADAYHFHMNDRESVYAALQGSVEDKLKHMNLSHTLREAKNMASLEFVVALGHFVKEWGYVPQMPHYRNYVRKDGSISYDNLKFDLSEEKALCHRAKIENGAAVLDPEYQCPKKMKKLEKVKGELSDHFWSQGDDPPIEAPMTISQNVESLPTFEILDRGYSRRLSRAGVLSIERAYPNSNNPKMILIGYEGIDRLEKDTMVPLVFTYGSENKGLEFQIGNEIPEDNVIKGRRILTLQILRFKKKAKEKPDALTNKELAAIADFIKQFDGKEISDSNNVLLTEIYPDPENATQLIAATWRISLNSSQEFVELGYQSVTSSGIR